MGTIWTSRGYMDEDELTFTSGCHSDDNEVATWQEWRTADGELVKRDAQVALKRGVEATIALGDVS